MTDAGPGELAIRLRRLREAAALTQEELAERAGLTAKAVGALERGERRRPYPHTVRALADALGLDEVSRTGLALLARAAPPADRPAVPARPAVTTDPGPAGAGATEPPPRPGAATLPDPGAPLLGREAERDHVLAALRSGSARLLTLTGPGGVGKTRLALDVARRLVDDLDGAVTWVELAPVTSAGLVLPTIAHALGGPRPAASDAASLAASIGSARRLLVLDNCEHVLDAAPDVAELLARCPGLLALATSRAPLRVRAERSVALEPLPLPHGDDVGAVAASPAAQVFLDRAEASGGRVRLTPATAAAVAAVCRRLEGLPLALELAAAHVRFLPPESLLVHLDHAVASSRSRDLPARQRTVRATLDWSHDLLTLDEQVLLRRLSVLRGDVDLTAAEAVAGAGVDVMTALSGLVEQSLLSPRAGSAGRFRLLEPVRQYAASRLVEAGEDAVTADRAAAHFQALARDAGPGLRGAEQRVWLDRLQRDHADLAVTVATLLERGRVREAAELGAATWLYWALRANAGEGLGWLEATARRAEERPGALGDSGLAALSVGLAGLRYASGDVAGTGTAAARAAEAARRAGQEQLLLEALVLAASAAVLTGDHATAAVAVEEAVGRAGDGHGWAATHALVARSQLLMGTGDLSSASAVLAEAEEAARALGSPFTLATVLNMRATVAQAGHGDDEGDDRALGWLTEAGVLAAEVGTTWTLVYTLPALAVQAARRGQWEVAAVLFGGGSATAEAAALALSFPPDLDSAQRWLHETQAVLGELEFHRAWEVGRRLSPGEVPELARRITGSP